MQPHDRERVLDAEGEITLLGRPAEDPLRRAPRAFDSVLGRGTAENAQPPNDNYNRSLQFMYETRCSQSLGLLGFPE